MRTPRNRHIGFFSQFHGPTLAALAALLLLAGHSPLAALRAEDNPAEETPAAAKEVPADESPEPSEDATGDATEEPKAQPAERPSIESLLQQISQSTAKAESPEDFSAILDLCQQADDAQASKVQQKYFRDTASWAHNRRGQLLDASDPAAALADFEAALRLDPTAWRPRYNRAISLAQAGKLEEAQADLNQVIQSQPGNFKALFNRGEVKFARGQVAQAIPDYDAALRVNPQSASAYAARGFARFRLGRQGEALNDYNMAISLDANNASYYVNRGDLLAETGQYGRATFDFKKALEIDPRASQTYLSWAWLMATCPEERYRNAESALSYARYANKEFGTDHYRYLDALAAALANAGQYEEAQKVQQKALDMTPEEEQPALQSRLDRYAAGQPFRTSAPVFRAQSP
ncbi:MAG: tetratricopeptide repeat protein [Pirellulales bacterium]